MSSIFFLFEGTVDVGCHQVQLSQGFESLGHQLFTFGDHRLFKLGSSSDSIHHGHLVNKVAKRYSQSFRNVDNEPECKEPSTRFLVHVALSIQLQLKGQRLL